MQLNLSHFKTEDMNLGLKMDAYLHEQAIKQAIKDVETQLETEMANGIALDNETEMLLQEELERLEYKLYRHNLLYK
tara:strand:+ start:116 stop:346 length:231 start_codon:yes stop_codon:yes gene_type:complete